MYVLPSISEELTEFDTCDSVKGESNINDLENVNKQVKSVKI